MVFAVPGPRRRRRAEATAGRHVRALAVSLTLLVPSMGYAATPLEAATKAMSAQSLAEAFREICLGTGFDPSRATMAMRKLGWRGTILQRPGLQARFTHWRTQFGGLQVGYRMIGGIDLRKYNCSLVVKEAYAPAPADLEAALEVALAPARFEDLKPSRRGPHRLARVTDRDEEQTYLIFSSGKVPMIEAGGAIALHPGLLIDYTYAKGPHARGSTGD
ncbi:MAG TPA: hypothetical protein VF782_11080 [Allosphingosinicella sp.]|jgi:hypothetical protein